MDEQLFPPETEYSHKTWIQIKCLTHGNSDYWSWLHTSFCSRPENQLDSTTAAIIKRFISSAIIYQIEAKYIYEVLRIETGVTQLQWSLLWWTLTTSLYACKASSSVSYLFYNCPKKAQNYPIPGLYSDIFAIYLLDSIFRQMHSDGFVLISFDKGTWWSES